MQRLLIECTALPGLNYFIFCNALHYMYGSVWTIPTYSLLYNDKQGGLLLLPTAAPDPATSSHNHLHTCYLAKCYKQGCEREDLASIRGHSMVREGVQKVLIMLIAHTRGCSLGLLHMLIYYILFEHVTKLICRLKSSLVGSPSLSQDLRRQEAK